VIEILTFTILLILSGFFSSAETAFFSLSDGKLRLLETQKKKNARLIVRLKSDPQRLLITILIGNNIVNLFTASYATVVASNFFGSAALGIATGLTTLFILIFGEIVPKSLAFTHNVKVTQIGAPLLYALSVVFYPIAHVLLILNKYVNHLFGGHTVNKVTEDEIRIMARMGVEGGHIEYREHKMIENVFSFNDIEVGDIATPLYKVTFVNGMVPIDQIAYFVSQTRYSRFPVYDDNDTDDIIGYIHSNTIMKVLNSDDRDTLVKDHISPIKRVDETMKIERVFRSMQRNKTHLYLVHRENIPDDVIGLVTLENLLEEIVGEIEDETD
jgi:CBS domain containing-hemolysin-like protein